MSPKNLFIAILSELRIIYLKAPLNIIKKNSTIRHLLFREIKSFEEKNLNPFFLISIVREEL